MHVTGFTKKDQPPAGFGLKRRLLYRMVCVVAGFCLVAPGRINAQEKQPKDSVSISLAGGGVVSSQGDFLPFYLVYNRHGEVKDKDHLFYRASAIYKHRLSDRAELSAGVSARNELLSSYYIQLQYGGWTLNAGRLFHTAGRVNHILSTGSMGVSQNALPLPQVGLSMTDYMDVPLTNGFFKIKGAIRHAWFEKDRYIERPLLHEKSLEGKVVIKPWGLQLKGGLNHFAQWGGRLPTGEKLPGSFSDFIKVFFGQGASETVTDPDDPLFGEANALGNHLGIISLGVEKSLGNNEIEVFYQKFFEDATGTRLMNTSDLLVAANWRMGRAKGPVNEVYVEYLSTKYQSGSGIPDFIEGVDNMGLRYGGRDDFYNNFLYRTGWSYYGNVIGNPLLLTTLRVQKFAGTFEDYDRFIASNRVRAFHLGLKGGFKSIRYRLLLTYSKNFGTYTGRYEGRFRWEGIQTEPGFDYLFIPAQRQFYSLLEVGTDNFLNLPGLGLNIGLALDNGRLYNNFGTQVSVSYNINFN